MRLRHKDFAVTGKNPVTETVANGNTINLFQKLNYRYGFVSFVQGDDFHTYRGITFPANKDTVTAA